MHSASQDTHSKKNMKEKCLLTSLLFVFGVMADCCIAARDKEGKSEQDMRTQREHKRKGKQDEGLIWP
jgi:hypothetical protein